MGHKLRLTAIRLGGEYGSEFYTVSTLFQWLVDLANCCVQSLLSQVVWLDHIAAFLKPDHSDRCHEWFPQRLKGLWSGVEPFLARLLGRFRGWLLARLSD